MQKAPDRVRGHGCNSISWMLMRFLSAAPLLEPLVRQSLCLVQQCFTLGNE